MIELSDDIAMPAHLVAEHMDLLKLRTGKGKNARVVLAKLHVSRQALGRALAGLVVRRGTVALLRAGLASPQLRAVLEERNMGAKPRITIHAPKGA